MKVQIFGPGCRSCKQLHEQVVKAIKELGKDIEVEYVTDVSKIIELGVMSSPALVIDGKIASAGSVPSIEKIKEMLKSKTNDKKNDSPKSCCSCGGKC